MINRLEGTHYPEMKSAEAIAAILAAHNQALIAELESLEAEIRDYETKHGEGSMAIAAEMVDDRRRIAELRKEES